MNSRASGGARPGLSSRTLRQSRRWASPRAPSMTIPAVARPQGSEAAHEPHCASSWQHRSDALTHSAAHGGGVDAVYSSVEYIFGFGSLISHPGFEYSEVVRPCYIKGYRRVFWQGSTDHRGTPEAPGRTVTLEPCEGAVTWGAAFRLAGDAEQRRRTWHYLEWREKQYDQRAQVTVYCPALGSSGSLDGSGVSDQSGSGVGGVSESDEEGVPALTALTFIATSDKSRNPNYLGPAPLEAIAHQIATSRGPSGPNYEYLFRLADAMRSMDVVDEELFQLEAKVRARMGLMEAGGADGTPATEAGGNDGSKGRRPAVAQASVSKEV
ncbi:hypothetical protein ABPG77_003985 [Micractinium sp. CCAP 211/92]